MRFDARDLAHAWLAVSSAAGQDRDQALTYKTVAIEEFTHGVRLISTDRRVLLTSWVRELGEMAEEPDRAELPDRTVIASDGYGRGRGLLGYLLSLCSQHGEDYAEGTIQVEILFDVRVPAGALVPDTLDGLEPTYCVLDSRDVERVYLPVMESAYVDWRLVFDSFTPAMSREMRSEPEMLERLGKARKHAPGPLLWTFGGAGRSAHVVFTNSDPLVRGVVLPTRGDDDPEDEADQ